MTKNDSLNKAKTEKNDEFYTNYEDIEKELANYKQQFKDKAVYCNCDNPYESNFLKYFALNFKALGLKSLTCTCYDSSRVVEFQTTLDKYFGIPERESRAYMLRINSEIGNTIRSLDDLQKTIQADGVLTKLKGNGDFRSRECSMQLANADIVVSNPPFSLFRDYMAQIMESNKKFIVIGNMNAVHYKEIFPLIRDNKVWLGYNHISDFVKPGGETQSFGNIVWFTNLEVKRNESDLVLTKTYNPTDYPKYDNYDAIEVSKVGDIPIDYDGVMGVPMTFLEKYNPNQYKIMGSSRFHDGKMDSDDINFIDGKQTFTRLLIQKKRNLSDFEIVGLMSGASGDGLVTGNDGRSLFHINGKAVFVRVLIQRRKEE